MSNQFSNGTNSNTPVRFLPIVLYLAMLLAAVALFMLICQFGATLTAPAAATDSATPTKAVPRAASDALLHVLLALIAVIIVGRFLGRVFARFGQPPVIGEVMAGIFIGPSLLGRISPELSAYLLPQSVAPYLSIVAQFGVILYMFTVGLDLDIGVLRRRGHVTLAISHASIVAPFTLGALLSLGLYPIVAERHVPFTIFALFLGVSMSVTAFPVLARILTDRKLHKTELGLIALTSAAAGDVTAWCLLAFVVGMAQSAVGSALIVIGLTLAYVAIMFLIVRPILARVISPSDEELSQSTVAAVFLALLFSAWLTEFIGIHAIFGAFLMGAVIPHESAIARQFAGKLQDLVGIVLLPAFFAITGMRTEISLIAGWQDWLLCGLITAVATLGKFGGTFIAARLTGLPARQASALGILMNTRGLMELIVLNIGLDLQVITPRLFAMLVVMALLTTVATTPILQRLVRPENAGQTVG